MSYDDDEVRWEVMTAFVRLGLAQGEKVMLFPDPWLPEAEVLARLDFTGPGTMTARERGQLVLSSMRVLIRPDRRFTPERQIGRLHSETARAAAEGFTGLRAFIDMRWVPDLNADVRVMMHRETHADALFEGHRYSEICAYDRRWFGPEVLHAMDRAHPRSLLERLGTLRSVRGGDGSVHFIGDADTPARRPFVSALELALSGSTGTRRLTVDLTRLHLLSVGCATALIVLAARAAGHDLVEVRCDRVHARTLHRLGAGAVPRLVTTEVIRPC
ncbi:MEDS domain-containing protein [Streptomyces sp. CB02923]|uniref:MEDS domain-containing protein n=1 Tax=Streptomyces sp. CB02923 TaxID=1718985 RepID=UPI001F5C0468|nr:MEDS domain-containing protein [Streptomyces sp. CB02923]